ncbi:MAG: cytidine deaminase [Tenericutes bacterium]|nr:cytidine deaminase [Mycoplasmatota bacterium]
MKELYEIAKENIKNAYVPYSKFRVSAALKLKNGEVYKGVNVENAAYGLCNCAERSALFAAYSNGVRKDDIESILVYTDQEHYVSPCGSCRQVISELMPQDATVFLATSKGDIKEIKNKDLLPFGFSSEDM